MSTGIYFEIMLLLEYSVVVGRKKINWHLTRFTLCVFIYLSNKSYMFKWVNKNISLINCMMNACDKRGFFESKIGGLQKPEQVKHLETTCNETWWTETRCRLFDSWTQSDNSTYLMAHDNKQGSIKNVCGWWFSLHDYEDYYNLKKGFFCFFDTTTIWENEK